jgi:hypothetical protein
VDHRHREPCLDASQSTRSPESSTHSQILDVSYIMRKYEVSIYAYGLWIEIHVMTTLRTPTYSSPTHAIAPPP